jgi:hypothetical protein
MMYKQEGIIWCVLIEDVDQDTHCDKAKESDT